MARLRNSKRISFLRGLIPCLGLALMPGCGARRNSSGPAAVAFVLPDFLVNPPPLAGVPIGSRDVVAYPPSGSLGGPGLLRLQSEPGAKIFYAFSEEGVTGASPYVYDKPLPIFAPIDVYAQAELAGERGPVRHFRYTEDLDLWPALTDLQLQRLSVKTNFTSLENALKDQELLAAARPQEGSPAAIVLDGKADEWPRGGLFYAEDGLYDVPQGYVAAELGRLDLSWVQAYENDDGLYIVLATRTPASSASASIGTIFYDMDLALSQISAESFGNGLKPTYRIEVSIDPRLADAGGANPQLHLFRTDTNKEASLSSTSRVSVADVVEVFIAKADLTGIDGTREVSLRCFSSGSYQNTTVIDKVEPILLRTQFDVTRSEMLLSGRPIKINFYAETFITNSGLPESYAAMAQQLLPELEAANQIRLQATGSLPFFYSKKEENGYSGLNTSDRGVLTTVGPNASMISRAQLLAHELAHYQNARYSQIKDRWLQEGMSEWSAARLLTQHFPARAVYTFLRSLRFDNYFDELGTKTDDGLRLQDWSGDAVVLGYEKSFMFFSLLENRLGSEALRRVFQHAVNEPVDSEKFVELLTQETGQDVKAMLPYWVTEGEAAPGLRPQDLFQDADGDEILTVDEQRLGTDPARPDSDGDGYLDSDEFYLGRNPTRSDVDVNKFSGTDVVLAGANQEASQLLRLASDDRGQSSVGRTFYALNPFAAQADKEFQTPLLYRPPYSLAVQAKFGENFSGVQTLTAPLYMNGAQVVPSYPAYEILSQPSRTTANLLPGSDIEGGSADLAGEAVEDHLGDLPSELSAYDLTRSSMTAAATDMTIALSMRTNPDTHGTHGNYVISFDAVDWSDSSPVLTRFNLLSINRGSPYWHSFSNGSESVRLLDSGIDLQFSQTLTIKLDRSLYAAWLAQGGEKIICAYSDLKLPGGASLRDRAGCISVAGSNAGYVRRDVVVEGSFAYKHQLALSLAQGIHNNTRMDHYQKLGASALRTFETIAGRPFLERRYWPMHLNYAAGTLEGSAMLKTGAYLTLPTGMSQARMDYLFVEQMARLVMVDLLDKTSVAQPYWLQEVFIQWLAASTMYRLARTVDVHDFHYDRLVDLVNFLNGGGPGYPQFTADVPLKNWNLSTLGSTGSVKSLLALLRLNTLVGAEPLAKTFSSYFNEIPSANDLKAMLQGYAPSKSAQIATLWSNLIEGSGNSTTDAAAILDSLEDSDNDGIYKFEEVQVGSTDAAYSPL